MPERTKERVRAASQASRSGRAPSPGEDARGLHLAILLAVTTLAVGLRVYRLDHDPLWFDEAYTALTARKSIGDIVRLLRTEVSAPLYYVLLHAWEQMVGDSDLRLRLLSALTGAAIVPAIYLVGSRMFSPAVGLIAAALAAVGPLHVHYSQELRMYGLLPSVALGVLYGFQRLTRAPDGLGVAVVAVAMAAGLYLHYYVLFLFPLAGIVLLSPVRSRALVHATVALGLAGLAFAPWMATLLGQAGPTHATDWIAGWWTNRSLWSAIPWSLAVLGPGAVFPPGWFKLGSSTVAGGISLVFAVLVLGRAAWDAAHARGEARAALLLTLAAVVVPLALALCVSLVRSPIYVVGRYDIIAWAPYVLLAGAVFARLPVLVAAPAVALWLVLSGVTLVPHFTTDRSLIVAANGGFLFADRLGRRAAPDDLVIFAASSRPTTEYYLGTWGERLRMVSYPLGTDDHLGWIDLRVANDEAFAADEARRMATWIADLQPRPRHIWLVVPYAAGNLPLVEAIGALGYAPDPARSAEQILSFVDRSHGAE